MRTTWYDTLKYWNGKEILRECKDKNRLCVHANVWNTCTDKFCEKGSKLLGKEADQFIIDEANAYTKGEKMTITDHDGCKDCKWEMLDPEEEPCAICKHNYRDHWTETTKSKEFTQGELIMAFWDAFQGRRVISLMDIENVIRGLYE